MKTENITTWIVVAIVCIVWAVFITKVWQNDRDKTAETELVTKTVTETTAAETETTEPVAEIDEELDVPPDENAYRRVVYIPEYVIAPFEIEFAEDEEFELAAPEAETFKPFTTYVRYNDGKRVKFGFSESGQKAVYEMSEKYGLPYRTVLAILGVETDWNENDAHRETNDGTRYIGIGCICEKYHAESLAAKGIDVYTLEGNIEGVCYLLKAQYDRFGNMNHAIMAYHGGGGYASSLAADGISETSYTIKVHTISEGFE